MNGVVSLLDDKHYQLVEDLWLALKRQFGVEQIYKTPYPHFSYHVSPHYEQAQLIPLLQAFAQQTAVFTIRTTGLGIFTGSHPVVYIPVVRTPSLTALHQTLWTQVETTSQQSIVYYEPKQWLPHITLAHGDIGPDTLSSMLSWLNQQTLDWEITIDNVSLIRDTGNKQVVYGRYPFQSSKNRMGSTRGTSR